MGNPKFAISATKDGQVKFNLTAKNGQVILTSESYKTKAACMNGVESVKKNSTDDGRFERKESTNGKHYFTLKAGNGQIIGQSEMYNSKSSMENGIESVKSNASIAQPEE